MTHQTTLKIKPKYYNLKRFNRLMASVTQIITLVAILIFIVLGFKLAKKIFWGLALIALIIFLVLTFVF